MALKVSIRIEDKADHEAVRAINTQAFGQPDEAKLVDALRGSVDPFISLVAQLEGVVVGHIMFSPVRIESDAEPWSAMGLAPMAVSCEYQRQGIGGALIRAGLDKCLRLGQPIVFVLGHPEYYPRFGFVSAPPLGLRCEYDVPDEVFMVLELEPGAIAGRSGLVSYAAAFNALT